MVCSVIYIISKWMWKTAFGVFFACGVFFVCLFVLFFFVVVGFFFIIKFFLKLFLGRRQGGFPHSIFFTFTTQGFVFFFSFYHLNFNVLRDIFLLAFSILLFNFSSPFNMLPYSRQFPLLKLNNTVLCFLIILIVVKLLRSYVKVDLVFFSEATKSKLWKGFHATVLNH